MIFGEDEADLDLVVYGATGFTGRLVVERLAQRYGGDVAWGMAGRSAAKLAEVRDEIGAPADTPLIVADAADPQALRAMARRARAVVSTVGPYQLYGSELVAACVETGTDYLDLSGEPIWMRSMIDAHEAAAKQSGARILFSCGFDSIPSELGVWFAQERARALFGAPAPAVKGRIRALRGGLSGGTAASGAATREALSKAPDLLRLVLDPFALTPGFVGPPQPPAHKPRYDEDVGEVSPFFMATINAKAVHRSNFLMGHPYGTGFLYDEMAIGGADAPDFTNPQALQGGPGAAPGDGPSRAEREAGYYDLLFIAIAEDGRKARVSVKGDMDPGYGSTAKILVETALCLIASPDVAAGVWTPGAALQGRLLARLSERAGLSFEAEDD